MRRDERMARGRAAGAGRARPDRLHGFAQRLRRPPAAHPRATARPSTSAASGSGSSTRRIRRTAGMPACSTRRRRSTLMCGDLFTQLGDGPALTSGDVVGPAIAGEDLFQYSSLNPGMGATHPAARDACAAHARPDAWPVLRGRRRGCAARAGGRLRPPHPARRCSTPALGRRSGRGCLGSSTAGTDEEAFPCIRSHSPSGPTIFATR